MSAGKGTTKAVSVIDEHIGGPPFVQITASLYMDMDTKSEAKCKAEADVDNELYSGLDSDDEDHALQGTSSYEVMSYFIRDDARQTRLGDVFWKGITLLD